MIKKYLKKHIPTHESIKQNKKLVFLGPFIHNQNLWHFNVHSVAIAVSIGLFIGYLPLPGHMIMASLLAVVFQANLPISIGLVWYSNPFTYTPLYYIAYKVGSHILGTEPEKFHFETNYHWFVHEFDHFAIPLLLGSLVCGATLSLLGYLGVRLYYFLKSKSRQAD
jgi:uncharacterized protein